MGEDAPRPWRRLTTEESQTWAEAIVDAVAVDRDRRRIMAAATCPACNHSFVALLTEQEILEELQGDQAMRSTAAYGPGSMTPALDWSGLLPFELPCVCEETHPGRPAVIRHGCGASAWFEDTPPERP